MPLSGFLEKPFKIGNYQSILRELNWGEDKMKTMISEVYEAFKATGIDDEKSLAIAQAVASQENLATKEDLLRLETKLTVRFGGMLVVAVGMIAAFIKIL